MALTDEEQLAYIKSKFCERIDDIETLANMRTFIINVTPANVRTFLQTKLQEDADLKRVQSTDLNTRADELEILKSSL